MAGNPARLWKVKNYKISHMNAKAGNQVEARKVTLVKCDEKQTEVRNENREIFHIKEHDNAEITCKRPGCQMLKVCKLQKIKVETELM